MLMVGTVGDLRGGGGERGERSIGGRLQCRHQGSGRQKAQREAASLALYIFEINKLAAILAFKKFHRSLSGLRPVLIYFMPKPALPHSNFFLKLTWASAKPP